jgi:hypothetical protein
MTGSGEWRRCCGRCCKLAGGWVGLGGRCWQEVALRGLGVVHSRSQPPTLLGEHSLGHASNYTHV